MGMEPFGFRVAVIFMDQMGWAVLARSCRAQLPHIGNNASGPLDRIGTDDLLNQRPRQNLHFSHIIRCLLATFNFIIV